MSFVSIGVMEKYQLQGIMNCKMSVQFVILVELAPFIVVYGKICNEDQDHHGCYIIVYLVQYLCFKFFLSQFNFIEIKRQVQI